MEPRSPAEGSLRRCNTSATSSNSRRVAGSPREHITAISPSAYHRVNSFPAHSLDAFSVSSSSSSSSSTVSLGQSLSQHRRLPSNASTASLHSATQKRTKSPFGSSARISSLGSTLQSLRQISVEHQRQIEELEDANCQTLESLDDLCAHLPNDASLSPSKTKQPHQELRFLSEEVASLNTELRRCKDKELELETVINELHTQLQHEKERYEQFTESVQCELATQEERKAQADRLREAHNRLNNEIETLRARNNVEVSELQDRLRQAVHTIGQLRSNLLNAQTRQEESTQRENAAVEEQLRSTQLENQRLQARVHELERQLQVVAAGPSELPVAASSSHTTEAAGAIQPEPVRSSTPSYQTTIDDGKSMKRIVQGLSYTVTAGIIVAAGVRVGIDLFGRYLKNT